MRLFAENSKFILMLLIISSLGLSCKNTDSTIAPPPTPPTVTGVVMPVDVYLTTGNGSLLLKKQVDAAIKDTINQFPTITLDTTKVYQEMDGFGFALTGGSAFHIFNMSAAKRSALLRELFSTTDDGIGISYLRISIGASDLDAEVFSYNDLAPGETDIDMQKFSLAPDQKWLIPVIKEVLAINPNIKILGSPWSAPLWMKSNGAAKGGTLRPEYYDVYARYFAKYVQEMAIEGITIDAITIQNEPLFDGNVPSMYMDANNQSAFIKNNLGPVFAAASIKTKIILYDHNADRTDYPISILNDQATRKYVDGSAFHLYGGKISDLSAVHTAHPDKNLYFTEQWIGAPGNLANDLTWNVRELIIGGSRNWCKVVLQWNLAANSKLEPHTVGGCTQCLGALTIDGDVVVRNPAYYVIGHASKFVRPGSVRIDSNSTSDLPNVAFKTTDGHIVIIVLNNTDKSATFKVQNGAVSFTTTLVGGAVATYIW